MLKKLYLLILFASFSDLNAHGGAKAPGGKAGRNVGVVVDYRRIWPYHKQMKNAQNRKKVLQLKQKQKSITSRDCCYVGCALVTIGAWAAFSTWMVMNDYKKGSL